MHNYICKAYERGVEVGREAAAHNNGHRFLAMEAQMFERVREYKAQLGAELESQRTKVSAVPAL